MLLLKILPQIFQTVIYILSNVLVGDQQPRAYVIVGPVITQIGSKIHVGITDWVRFQFKVLINFFEHGHSIVMNNKDSVDIAQDFVVLAIVANVNFGIDPYVRAG